MEENFNQVPQNSEEPVVHQEPVSEQPMNSAPVFNEPVSEEKTKKKGKALPIILGVVAVIVIALVGGFFYFKSTRTATKYIDTKVKDVKKSIEESFSNEAIKSIGTLDLFNEDIVTDGKIKISGSADVLGGLNGLELAYDLKSAFSKDYLEAKLSAKNSSDSIEGALYLDGKTLYLDAKDIMTNPLKAVQEQNVFAELKEMIESTELEEYKDLMDLETLKEFSLKTVDFVGTALKETVTSTKQKGLNIEYVYELNNDTLKKAVTKLQELIKGDKKYSDLIKDITGMNDININVDEIKTETKVVVTIEVNMFNNNLENITVVVNDQTILSKVGEDQYKLLYAGNSDKNYALLTIKDEEFKVSAFVDGKEYGNFEIISKKKDTTIKFEIKEAGISATIKFTEVSKNETKVELNADVTIANINLNATIKANGNKLSTEGTLEATVEALIPGMSKTTIKLDFESNYNHGKDLVTKANISNAKAIETMTYDDYNAMESKLETKLTNLGLLDYLTLLSKGNVENATIEEVVPYEFDYEL